MQLGVLSKSSQLASISSSDAANHWNASVPLCLQEDSVPSTFIGHLDM